MEPETHKDVNETRHEKYTRRITEITDEGGLKRAYETKYGFYQHYNNLFIAGTKDFPNDHIDDLKLPLNDTLN